MHYKKSVFRSLAMVTQLGLSVVTPVFLCVFAGYQLDRHWGINLLIPLLILGVLAGGRCAWQMTRRILEQEQRDDELLRRKQMERTVRQGVTKPKKPSRIRTETTLPGMDLARENQADKEDDSDGMAEQTVEATDS